MRMFRRLEQALGRFAIPQLTIVLIACQVVAFVMMMVRADNSVVGLLTLIPSRVLEGEVWRLITFVALPPPVGRDVFAIIWAFFFWYMFYLMGNTLEHNWGVFRYNAYLLIWYVATVGAAFLTPEMPTANVFLFTSIFLAFAFLFPNFELRLFLILPVKIKWLAWLAGIGLGLAALSSLLVMQFSVALTIFASFTNYFIFFGKEMFEKGLLKRRRVARGVNELQTARHRKPYHHRCTVCGKTDASDPHEDFRYCSQCAGQHAYCSEHLRNHEHVPDEAEKD